MYASTLFAQYSNATLNGPWWLGFYPFHIYNADSTLYLVFDGNGNITDWNGFGPGFNGNYSVTTSGAISGTVSWHDGSVSLTAQLVSQNFAIVDSGTLGKNMVFSRITNPGALTDSLVGILYSGCGQENVTLRLNGQGQIISSSGLLPPVTGRVYSDSGHFEGHVKTGMTTPWNEFTIIGADVNDSLTGVVGLDSKSCSGTVHLKRMGIVTGIGPMKTARVPESFSLAQNFPNPFNPGTTISYQIPAQGHVTLKVFDVLGREIATLVNKDQIAGYKSVTWDASNIPSGLYFYRLQTKDFTQTRKLLLMK
jgi:hypothetical protein